MDVRVTRSVRFGLFSVINDLFYLYFTSFSWFFNLRILLCIVSTFAFDFPSFVYLTYTFKQIKQARELYSRTVLLFVSMCLVFGSRA